MHIDRPLVMAAALAVASPVAAAGFTGDVVPGFAGLGAAAASARVETKELVAGIVPAVPAQAGEHGLAEPDRPSGEVDSPDVPERELGPAVPSRIGRQSVGDVPASVWPATGAGVETGLFGGYHYLDPQGLPWHLRTGMSLVTAIGGDPTNGHITPCAAVWMPLGRTAFIGFGAGFTWSSAAVVRQPSGIGRAAPATSALPPVAPGSGVRGLHAGPAVVLRLSPEWFAAGGAFYQRPTGPAANGGAFVTQRGDRNPWSVGAGIARAWR